MGTMNQMIDAIEELVAKLAREEDATDEARRCAEIQRRAKFMALGFHGQGLDRKCKADRFPWEYR